MITPMVQVALQMDDGTVAVMGFITHSSSPTLPYGATWNPDGTWQREPTDANIFAEISKAFPGVDQNGLPKPQPISYKVIEPSSIPADRSYRNAWVFDGAKVDHDIEKAKAIHLDKIRRARTRALGELDIEYSKLSAQAAVAEAAKDNKTKAEKTAEALAIEGKRQALRDAPQTLDLSNVTTIDELKAIWPEELPPR